MASIELGTAAKSIKAMIGSDAYTFLDWFDEYEWCMSNMVESWLIAQQFKQSEKSVKYFRQGDNHRIPNGKIVSITIEIKDEESNE